MSAYQQWSQGYAKQVIRRELMDSFSPPRWWSDNELNIYLDNWQQDLQQEFELTWATSTITTALNTISVSAITPTPDRIDAIYYIGTEGGRGYRLSGRLLQDLEVGNVEWRNATPDTPREVIQYDSTQLIIWPPLQNLGTFIFEYPKQLTLSGDASLLQVPIWAQWSCKPYVCMKAFMRTGPTNDLKKALRYKAQYEKEKQRIRLLWDNWLPERYRKLKPAGHYEWDILFPPTPDASNQSSVGIPSFYQSFQLIPDGSSVSFNLSLTPVALKLYRNGLLQTQGIDYIWSGNNVTFIGIAPASDDVLIVWTFSGGGM